MNFGLSQEQEMIVDTVRDFVEKEIYTHEAEVERTGNVPLELGQSIKQKVIDLGFYACNFDFLDVVRILYTHVRFYQVHQMPQLCDHQELACTPKHPPRRVIAKK